MDIKSAQAEAGLRRNIANAPIILIHGQDAGLISETAHLAAKISGVPADDPFSYLRLDGDVLLSEPGRLVDEARSIAMFGGRRLIWVALGARSILPQIEVLAAEPPQDAIIILQAGELRNGHALRTLCETSPNAISIACYADESKSLAQIASEMISKAGKRIESDALEELGERLGRDRALSRGEIEKLLTYCGDADVISLIDIEAIIGDAGAIEPSTAIDAAFSGKVSKVEEEAQRALRDGTDAGFLLLLAERHVQALLAIEDFCRDGAPLKDAIRRNGIHFRREAAVVEHRRLWTIDKLVQTGGMLRQAVLSCRMNAQLSESICVRALWTLALGIKR
jgi:DNA polymerase III subunit delta